MRIAVRGADSRASDACAAAGHQLVDEAECEALIVVLDEVDASLADAYVLGSRMLPEAIAWVAAEDRSLRTTGQPRLTIVGSIRDDFGMSRPLGAEPTILGRSTSFGREHPLRPDRIATPTGTIARHHAQVRRADGVIAIRDLRSTNGTLLIRRGQPARLLCPQQADGGREFGPPASSQLVRDPTPDWVELAIGDQIQLPGFWRFRIDGQTPM